MAAALRLVNLLPAALAISLSLAAGCGSDPVSVSEPIGIELKVKSSDVATDGTVTADKNITTESGNPWGKFVGDAEAKLGGQPGRIDLDLAALSLGPASSGVAALGEIFDGEVTVQFETDSATDYAVAAGTVDASSGNEVELDPGFSFGDFQDAELDALLAGTFRVVLVGPTTGGFAGAGADADLELTLDFSAFE
jgi:hypothetical protein